MTTISREPTRSERVPALVKQFKVGLAGGLPRPDKDHPHRRQAVPLGMPSLRVPAKLCDSSPLAVTA